MQQGSDVLLSARWTLGRMHEEPENLIWALCWEVDVMDALLIGITRKRMLLL